MSGAWKERRRRSEENSFFAQSIGQHRKVNCFILGCAVVDIREIQVVAVSSHSSFAAFRISGNALGSTLTTRRKKEQREK